MKVNHPELVNCRNHFNQYVGNCKVSIDVTSQHPLYGLGGVFASWFSHARGTPWNQISHHKGWLLPLVPYLRFQLRSQCGQKFFWVWSRGHKGHRAVQSQTILCNGHRITKILRYGDGVTAKCRWSRIVTAVANVSTTLMGTTTPCMFTSHILHATSMSL